jgi:hypothetical protein
VITATELVGTLVAMTQAVVTNWWYHGYGSRRVRVVGVVMRWQALSFLCVIDSTGVRKDIDELVTGNVELIGDGVGSCS